MHAYSEYIYAFFRLGNVPVLTPISDRLLNSALSASSSPAYHRSHREPHSQSGRVDSNLRRRKMVTNHDLAIRLSKFQMVVKSSRELLLLDFLNSKWWIQYGGEKFEKLRFGSKFVYRNFRRHWSRFGYCNFLLKNRRVGLWNYPNVITIEKSTPVTSEMLGFRVNIIFSCWKHMKRFTSTVPARGARASNRAISNSCLWY